MHYIYKCHGTNCPIRDTCWRYIAPPTDYQQYIIEQYTPASLPACVNYRHIEPVDVERPKR